MSAKKPTPVADAAARRLALEFALILLGVSVVFTLGGPDTLASRIMVAVGVSMIVGASCLALLHIWRKQMRSIERDDWRMDAKKIARDRNAMQRTGARMVLMVLLALAGALGYTLFKMHGGN